MKIWCKGYPELGANAHWENKENFYIKSKKNPTPRMQCKKCYSVWNKSPYKQQKNSIRYGSNADPKYRASYSKAGARSRAERLECRPQWMKHPILQLEYDTALLFRDNLNKIMGKGSYHLDHEIPLRARDDVVCGLDVPWNLRLMLATDNLSRKYEEI